MAITYGWQLNVVVIIRNLIDGVGAVDHHFRCGGSTYLQLNFVRSFIIRSQSHRFASSQPPAQPLRWGSILNSVLIAKVQCQGSIDLHLYTYLCTSSGRRQADDTRRGRMWSLHYCISKGALNWRWDAEFNFYTRCNRLLLAQNERTVSRDGRTDGPKIIYRQQICKNKFFQRTQYLLFPRPLPIPPLTPPI